MPRLIYLHGFASGPASRKAIYFKDALASLAIPLEIPDLAQGRFHDLTITSQLELLERIIANEPAALIGSSMGGYLAALYAARHPEVTALVLLAPAFDFYKRWGTVLGPEKMAQWRQTGEMLVYHYAENREVPLGYGLMEDAAKHEPFPAFSQRALIFHGTEDTVVPISYSERFVAAHSNVGLVRLQSGHELTDVLSSIWSGAGPLLLQTVGY